MQQHAATAPPRNATCLIVEDSQFDQQMMTRVVGLSQGKMQVEVAATLHSARQALAAGEVSLILLDNNMPGGLGAEFALELASDPHLSSIPVIMVSD